MSSRPCGRAPDGLGMVWSTVSGSGDRSWPERVPGRSGGRDRRASARLLLPRRCGSSRAAVPGAHPDHRPGGRAERQRPGRRAGGTGQAVVRGQHQSVRGLRRELRQSQRRAGLGRADLPGLRSRRQRHAAVDRDRSAATTASGSRRTSSSAPASSTRSPRTTSARSWWTSDWAGAAIAAANGYREALGGSSSTWWWVAGGIVVVGGGGYLIYRRSGRRPTAEAGEVGPDGQPQEPLEPLDQLSARSVQTLIDTDNAVRASEFELSAAESEFGTTPSPQFRSAFDAARESLDRGLRDPAAGRRRRAGGRRHQARDDERDPHPMRRRRRQARVGERPVRRATRPAIPVAAGAGRAAGQHRRAAGPGTGGRPRPCCGCSSSTHRPRWRTSPRTSTRPPSGWRSPDSSARQAQQLVGAGTGRPDGHPAAARTTRGRPGQPGRPSGARRRRRAGSRGSGADPAGRDRARRHRPGHSGRSARRGLYRGGSGAGCRPRHAELRPGRGHRGQPARPAGPDPGDPGCRPFTAGRGRPADRPAQGGGGRSGPRHHPGRDPDAQQQEQRAQAGLAQALSAARAEVGSAQDFITTRRGAVGSQARTRLAEAKRHLANAESLAGSNAAGRPGRGAAGGVAGPRGLGPRPAGCRRLGRRWRRRSAAAGSTVPCSAGSFSARC